MRRVSIVLDASASMTNQRDRLISGVNEYISKLQKELEGKKCKLEVHLFDDSRPFEPVFVGKLSDGFELTAVQYKTGGMTPLYDAVGRAIGKLDMRAKKGDKVIVVIDTDGMENTSREFSSEAIQMMVADREKLGWAFVFMASGLTENAATSVAYQNTSVGIVQGNTRAFVHSDRSAVYASTVNATMDYFSGKVSNKALFDLVDGKKTAARVGP